MVVPFLQSSSNSTIPKGTIYQKSRLKDFPCIRRHRNRGGMGVRCRHWSIKMRTLACYERYHTSFWLGEEVPTPTAFWNESIWKLVKGLHIVVDQWFNILILVTGASWWWIIDNLEEYEQKYMELHDSVLNLKNQNKTIVQAMKLMEQKKTAIGKNNQKPQLE